MKETPWGRTSLIGQSNWCGSSVSGEGLSLLRQVIDQDPSLWNAWYLAGLSGLST